MIIKSFELEKLKSTKIKKILFYGENEGYKNQIITNIFIQNIKTRTIFHEITNLELNKLLDCRIIRKFTTQNQHVNIISRTVKGQNRKN